MSDVFADFRSATTSLAATGLMLADAVRRAGVTDPTLRAYHPVITDAVRNLERAELAYLEAYAAIAGDSEPGTIAERNIAVIRERLALVESEPIHREGRFV